MGPRLETALAELEKKPNTSATLSPHAAKHINAKWEEIKVKYQPLCAELQDAIQAAAVKLDIDLNDAKLLTVECKYIDNASDGKPGFNLDVGYNHTLLDKMLLEAKEAQDEAIRNLRDERPLDAMLMKWVRKHKPLSDDPFSHANHYVPVQFDYDPFNENFGVFAKLRKILPCTYGALFDRNEQEDIKKAVAKYNGMLNNLGIEPVDFEILVNKGPGRSAA
jgi:hypothetical protein